MTPSPSTLAAWALAPALALALAACALLTDAQDEVEGCFSTSECECGQQCIANADGVRQCTQADCTSDEHCGGCFPSNEFGCDLSTSQCVQCDGKLLPDGTCVECELGRKVCGSTCCGSPFADCFDHDDDTSTEQECCETGDVCGSNCCPDGSRCGPNNECL